MQFTRQFPSAGHPSIMGPTPVSRADIRGKELAHPAEQVEISRYTMAIDSRQRDCHLFPDPNDYVIELGDNLKNVASISLRTALMPRADTNVHSANKYIDFTIGSSVTGFKVVHEGYGYNWNNALNTYQDTLDYFWYPIGPQPLPFAGGPPNVEGLHNPQIILNNSNPAFNNEISGTALTQQGHAHGTQIMWRDGDIPDYINMTIDPDNGKLLEVSVQTNWVPPFPNAADYIPPGTAPGHPGDTDDPGVYYPTPNQAAGYTLAGLGENYRAGNPPLVEIESPQEQFRRNYPNQPLPPQAKGWKPAVLEAIVGFHFQGIMREANYEPQGTVTDSVATQGAGTATLTAGNYPQYGLTSEIMDCMNQALWHAVTTSNPNVASPAGSQVGIPYGNKESIDNTTLQYGAVSPHDIGAGELPAVPAPLTGAAEFSFLSYLVNQYPLLSAAPTFSTPSLGNTNGCQFDRIYTQLNTETLNPVNWQGGAGPTYTQMLDINNNAVDISNLLHTFGFPYGYSDLLWEFTFKSSVWEEMSAHRVLGFTCSDYQSLPTVNVPGTPDSMPGTTSPYSKIVSPYDWDLLDYPYYLVLKFYPNTDLERLGTVKDDDGLEGAFALLVFDGHAPDSVLGLTNFELNATPAVVYVPDQPQSATKPVTSTTAGAQGTYKGSWWRTPGDEKAIRGDNIVPDGSLEFATPLGLLNRLHIRLNKFGQAPGGADVPAQMQGRDHLLVFDIMCADVNAGNKY